MKKQERTLFVLALLLLAPLSAPAQTVTLTGSITPAPPAPPLETWEVAGELWVGVSGAGSLLIADGGTVSSLNGFVGFSAAGEATVSGAGSLWTNTNYLVVGEDGAGTLTLADGGVAAVTAGHDTLYLGQKAGSTGTLNLGAFDLLNPTAAGVLDAAQVVFGAGTGLINFNQTGALTFAPTISGPGTVVQRGAGTTTLGAANTFAAARVKAGTLAVPDGASLAVNDGLIVGHTAGDTGTFVITGGGTVTAPVIIGHDAGSTGTVNVSGAGSLLTHLGIEPLLVGHQGTGTLNITDGGEVLTQTGINNPALRVGSEPGSHGTLNIADGFFSTGPSSTSYVGWGPNSTGILNVSGDSTVLSHFFRFGHGEGSLATVNITGGLVAGHTSGALTGAIFIAPYERPGSRAMVRVSGGTLDPRIEVPGSGVVFLGNNNDPSMSSSSFTHFTGALVVSDTGVVDGTVYIDPTGVLVIGSPYGEAPAAPGIVAGGAFGSGAHVAGRARLIFNHSSNDYWWTSDGTATGAAHNIDTHSMLRIVQSAGTTHLKSVVGYYSLDDERYWDGQIFVTGGTLIIASGSDIGSTAGGLLMQVGNDPAFNVTASTLWVGPDSEGELATAGGPGGGTVIIEQGALLEGNDINGNVHVGVGPTAALSTLTVAGTLNTPNLRIGGTGPGAMTVTGTVNNTLSATIAGTGGGGTGNGAVTVSNTGTWNTDSLTMGANGTGTLTLQAGGSVTIGGGAGTLNIVHHAATTGNVLNIGSPDLGNPTTAGTLNAAGVTFGTDEATINFNQTDATSFAPVITGGGSLVQRGSGSTTLTGNNTFTGGTQILAGVLQIGNGGAAGSLAGNVTNHAALVFNRSGSLTYGGVISGTGSLTKAGTGTLVLAGANAYSGATTVSGGTLQLATASLADTSVVSIANGAVLHLSHGATDVVGALYFNGMPQTAGVYHAGNSGGFITGTGSLQATTTPLAGYDSWIDGYEVGEATGFDDDADGDGFPNGLEHVLGTDPSTVASGGLVAVSGSANSLTFQHSQTNELALDITVSYEWSTDLVHWHASGATNVGGTTATIAPVTLIDNEAPDNDVIEVIVTVTTGPVGKLFARLVATRP